MIYGLGGALPTDSALAFICLAGGIGREKAHASVPSGLPLRRIVTGDVAMGI
jgi:hypothetical protein